MIVKLFGKKNQELEKRIFFSYFLLTFFLIILLLILEWQLARYGISQYEEINIHNILREFNINLNSELLIQKDQITSFSENISVVQAVENKDKSRLEKLKPQEMENLVISSREREVWFGINWDLIDHYLPQIYRKASQNQNGSFVVSLDGKLYLIAFSPCLTENRKEMAGIAIISKRLDLESLNLRTTQMTALLPYDPPISLNQFRNLKPFTEQINSIIINLAKTGTDSELRRINRDNAVGISMLYDLENNPSGLFLLSFERFVNSFVQQSVLLFILILVAISLIMLMLLGSWFSKAILLPVKNLNLKMKEIASNPSELGKFEKKYTGVLGEMVESFNIMNLALTNHSKTLNDYKLITDNIETGIFWLDKDFKVNLCNPSFLKIVEKTELDQVFGQNFALLFGLEKQFKSEVLNGNNIFPTLEIKPISTVKKYIILNIRSERSDKEMRFFGSITDITSEIEAIQAKEALEIELIKSNKLAEIGRNIEGIVHNLNSPLNSILGYSQLMKKSHPEFKDIDKILNAGSAAARIVKGLLDKVKKSNASMIHPVNVNEVIEQELELCNHNLFFKHYVMLEKDLQPDISPVLANFGDLSLALANLLNNAFDAMKDSQKKNLRVKSYQQKEQIFIEIEDSGEGIPKANLQKIFEAYYSTKKDRAGSGFGLGLAITKQIIEKYGGKIEVSSEIGLGSIFTIILNVEEKEQK